MPSDQTRLPLENHPSTLPGARTARDHEARAMKGMADEIANVQRALELFAREAQRRFSASVERALEREGEPIGPVFQRAHRAIHAAASAVEAACGHLRMDLATAADALIVEALVLTAVHDAEDKTYRAVVLRDDTDRERAK
jgi:hypothetical protein